MEFEIKKYMAGVAVVYFLLMIGGTAAEEYKSGENIEVSVMNATDGRMTAASCNITIYNNSVLVSTTPMTGTTGFYNWTIAGLTAYADIHYLAKVNCSIGSGFWLAYENFNLVDNRIQHKLNEITDRNVTQNYTGPSTSDIWTYTNRSLTEFPFALSVNLTQNAYDSLAASVWGYATRALTSFGSLITDIWTNSDRSLTQNVTENITIPDTSIIWSYSSRTLTQNVTENLTFLVPPSTSEIWANAVRTLTQNITQNVTNTIVNITNMTVSTATIYDNSTFNVILPAS